MPLVYEKELNNGTRVGVWEALEGDAFFYSGIRLHAAEEQELTTLQPRKKSEWLSSRYLLHLLTGRDERLITWKDDRGKPYLEGNTHHISLSHSGRFTAAILADFPTGVDIQTYQSKIQRIVPRFMSQQEQDAVLQQYENLQWHVYWGAKECLFKAYGKGSVDFKQHLFIDALDFNRNSCKGHIHKPDFNSQYELGFIDLKDCMLVYIKNEIIKE